MRPDNTFRPAGGWLSEAQAPPVWVKVRETPGWRVREQWAPVQQARIERELAAAHQAEYEAEETHPPRKRSLRLLRWWDVIGVWLCTALHRTAPVNWADNYSTCPACGRKYATPWARVKGLDPDVYICGDAVVRAEGRTLQAVCRSGGLSAGEIPRYARNAAEFLALKARKVEDR